jgi:hypothetical protein
MEKIGYSARVAIPTSPTDLWRENYFRAGTLLVFAFRGDLDTRRSRARRYTEWRALSGASVIGADIPEILKP